MTANDILIELGVLQDPLLKKQSRTARQRVFALYYIWHGEDYKRRGNCQSCAEDCFHELRYDLKHEFTKKSLNLRSKPVVMMTKYKLVKPFQPFGDPTVYNESNLTDQIADKLIKANPNLKSYFKLIETEPIKPTNGSQNSKRKNPPKGRKTRL